MKAPPSPFFSLTADKLVEFCIHLMRNCPNAALSIKESVVFLRYSGLWPSMTVSLLRCWTRSRKKAFKLANVNRCRVDENRQNKCRPRYLVSDLVDMCKLRTVRERAA